MKCGEQHLRHGQTAYSLQIYYFLDQSAQNLIFNRTSSFYKRGENKNLPIPTNIPCTGNSSTKHFFDSHHQTKGAPLLFVPNEGKQKRRQKHLLAHLQAEDKRASAVNKRVIRAVGATSSVLRLSRSAPFEPPSNISPLPHL